MHIPITLDDGSTVLLEVERIGETPVSAKGFSAAEAFAPVASLSKHVAEIAKAVSPDEFSVEFGVSFSMETGKLTAVLVKGSGEGNIKLTLKWSQEKK